MVEDQEEPVAGLSPPTLNKPRLWWSLLLPPATAALTGLAAAIFLRLYNYTLGAENWIVAGLWIWGAVALGSWILFAKTLLGSYRGRTAIILIVFYPIAQILLSATVYVGSCSGGELLFK